METIFMNTEKSKTNEPHKFVFHLSQRLDLRSSKKTYLFVSDIQDCIECIIKKHETLTTIPLINYMNRINNKLVFKRKDAYKLGVQTPGIIKLFGSTKKLIDKTKSGEKSTKSWSSWSSFSPV